MKELSEMSKKEKKDFFCNDFTERMIRVEQNVSASFNKPLAYDKTNLYKSLTPVQKKNFESYLKNKKWKKCLAPLLILVPAIAIALLNINFTGNVIRDNLDAGKISYLTMIFMGILAVFFCLEFFQMFFKKMRARRFKRNTKIIEGFVSKKYQTKK